MTRLDPFEVEVRGVRVRGIRGGRGPVLLLVHGFLVDHREWNLLAPQLAADFDVVAPDLPGFGSSDRPSPRDYPYTADAFAETLVALLDALRVDRAHVAGHSMGGAIAAVLAVERPARVDRLVLIDALGLPFPMPLKGRLPLLPGIGAFFFKRLYGRALFRDYFRRDVWSGQPGVDLALVDAYYDAFDANREPAWATLHATVRDVTPVATRLGRIAAPTLVVWGELDRIFPLEIGRRLARTVPGATLDVIEGVGHSPQEAAPERCARSIRSHLRMGQA
ncbi:MAG: alpha/beta hydrolase [Myxococcota bacterium]|nr:alpha/beta hydrolase [Myxococcota bacterium]MDW8360995.1 alpha/beta hydrolase [Myxococcales bacterium]